MTKRLLITTLVLLFPALAIAAPGTAGWTNVGYTRPAMDLAVDIDTYEGEGHRVVDLLVNVADGDRITTAGVTAHFQCVGEPGMSTVGTFWEHPMGANGPPMPALFGGYGLLEYDSFYTTPEDFPNSTLNANTSIVATDLQDCYRYAEWDVNPEEPNVDGGIYTMARYNFTLDCSLCPWGYCIPYDNGLPATCNFVIEGTYYYARTGDTPWAFSLEIPVCWVPEPGSIGLLSLGVLARLRRR